MRVRVAAEFPNALLIEFRKVRRIATEAGHEVDFCGQVSALNPGEIEQSYRVFLYDRTGMIENVRILGTEALNGYQTGQELIGALKRVGCL